MIGEEVLIFFVNRFLLISGFIILFIIIYRLYDMRYFLFFYGYISFILLKFFFFDELIYMYILEFKNIMILNLLNSFKIL